MQCQEEGDHVPGLGTRTGSVPFCSLQPRGSAVADPGGGGVQGVWTPPLEPEYEYN